MRITNLIGSLVLAVTLHAFPSPATASSSVQFGVAVHIRVGPPLLPVYVQPECPRAGYIWEPGYWSWGDDGYFWVPGVWVLPPESGLLWTPGYWAFNDGFYAWNAGYWGPAVGFYGGINYGFGYPGSGFYGGYWRGRDYFYNTRVTNVNTTIVRNVYTNNVVNESRSANRVSFNGGRGGTQARPTSTQLAAGHQRHVAMTSEQVQHQRTASTERSMLASVNHGRPDVAASTRHEPLSNRAPSHNNRPTATERPHTSEPAPAAKPAPHAERPPAHPSAPAPSPRPAPSHPSNAPEHRAAPAPRPAAPHAERPTAHPTTKQPAPQPSKPRPMEQRSGAPHSPHSSQPQTQPHAAAPHPSETPASPRPQQKPPEHERPNH